MSWFEYKPVMITTDDSNGMLSILIMYTMVLARGLSHSNMKPDWIDSMFECIVVLPFILPIAYTALFTNSVPLTSGYHRF